MSDSVLIRWSKRAAITAGVLWPLVCSIVFLVQALTGALYDSSPPKETVDLATLGIASAFYIPFVVLMLSLAGVYARYKEQWRVLGQVGLIVALIALAVIPIAGAAALDGSVQDFEPSEMGRLGTLAVVLATTVLGVGFVVFGLAALRSNTPSRWFGAILIGIGLFQPLILLPPVLRMLAYTVGWVVLGWALPAAKGNAAPC